MDRLTGPSQFGPQIYGKIQVRGDVSVYNDAIRKLSAYEDTGLAPPEIAALRAENERLRAALSDLIVSSVSASKDLSYISHSLGDSPSEAISYARAALGEEVAK